jgi:L-serine dehydratase
MDNSFNDVGQLGALPQVDRRSFLMRHAAIGAAAVMTGTNWTPAARAQQVAKEAAAPKLGHTFS